MFYEVSVNTNIYKYYCGHWLKIWKNLGTLHFIVYLFPWKFVWTVFVEVVSVRVSFAEMAFVRKVFVGTVFVTSIISSSAITESPIIVCKYSTFTQVHVLGF